MKPVSLASSSSSSSSLQLLRQKGLPLLTKASENAHAPAAKWIMGTAGLVVGMIHVGGVTRLTQSGLSMTTWSPLGSLPPLNKEQWQAEFERYKQFPEWSQRKSMALSDFQFIYAWEYGHRMLGRFVGVAFCVPWLYFTVRKKIPAGYQKRMFGLCALGGTQGLVGWWMVKSGLGEDRRDDRQEIRVKPVRLATHLTMALITYGCLAWTALDLFSLPHTRERIIDQISRAISKNTDALLKAVRLRRTSLALLGLTAVTITSGAIVAGNDAGRAYNTWPKMDGEWIPSDILQLSPWYRNSLENTATVQWTHRMLGQATGALAVYTAWTGLRPAASTTSTASTAAKAILLTPQARVGLYAVGIAATGQFTLGVVTLLNYVPLSLAAAHQLGSIVVFTSSLYLTHSLRYARPAIVRAVTAAARKSGSGGAASKNGITAASAIR